MERTQHARPAVDARLKRPTLDVDLASFSPSSEDSPRALFAPVHYESNYAYPLLVWLHSPGADERQLLRIMPLVSMRNYVAVAPQGFLVEPEGSGESIRDWPRTANHVEETAGRVFQGIEAVRRKFHVRDDRVFLAGFDSGGTMAFQVAMSAPHRFAGVLSLCGAFPRGHRPFARLKSARRLPVFLSVGRDSREYPVYTACDDLRLFHTAGVHVALEQYPCGQQLTPEMLASVDRWIMRRINSDSDEGFESNEPWLLDSE